MEGNIFSRVADSAGNSFNKVKSWINQLTDSDTRTGSEAPVPVNKKSVLPVTVTGRGSVGEHDGNNRLIGADGDFPYVEDLKMYFRDAVDQLKDAKSLRQRTGSVDDDEKSVACHAKPFKHQVSKLSMTCTEYSNDSGFCSHYQGRDVRPCMSNNDVILSFEELHEEYQWRSTSDTYDDARQRSASNPTLLKKRKSLAADFGREKHQRNPKGDKHGHASSRAVSVSSLVTTIKTQPSGSDDEKHDAKLPNYTFHLQHVVIDSFEETTGSYDDGIQSYAEQCLGLGSNVSKTMPNGAITGRLKLALQYFGSSKVLRVMVLRATDLKVKKGHVFPRLSVHLGKSKKKHKKISLRKVKAQQDVVFNEDAFFEDIDEQEIDELTLSVSIYNKEGMFRFTKCLGEMVIPVYKYDISMDTNIWGNLRQKRAAAEVRGSFDLDDDSDIEIHRDDRSISASVAATVHAIHPSPSFHRVRSMPSLANCGIKTA